MRACALPVCSVHTHRHAGCASDCVVRWGGCTTCHPVGAFLRHPPLWSKDQRDLLLPMYYTPGLIRARKYVKQSVRASRPCKASSEMYNNGLVGLCSE